MLLLVLQVQSQRAYTLFSIFFQALYYSNHLQTDNWDNEHCMDFSIDNYLGSLSDQCVIDTNQYVLNHLNVTKSLMKDIKSRKLKYFGHVKRHQNILKSVLEGIIEGRRCRGRQRSVWCDNLKGWTGRSVTACSAAAQNRTEWRSIVANLRTEDGT